MADNTGISWTDATWNPVRGCSRVSEGCRNCYAESVAARFSGPGQAYEGLAVMRKPLERIADFAVPSKEPKGRPRWTGVVRLIPEHLADPIRWKRARRIFVNSMSDLFHESLTNEEIAAVFGVMAAAPQHTFQVLTKRAKRMREWFEWAREQAIEAGEDRPDYGLMLAGYAGSELGDGSSGDESDQQALMEERINDAWARDGEDGGTVRDCLWPLPNVWLGVSVENQDAADERIPELLKTPASVRFLSCEPLLGAVDLEHVKHRLGERSFEVGTVLEGDDGFGLSAARNRIDWVIAGCESGPGARPCDVSWLRSLRNQCVKAGVAFFLKQAVELTTSRSVYPSARAARVEERVVALGSGSKQKSRGVIELPYLDGVQHAAFPEIRK